MINLRKFNFLSTRKIIPSFFLNVLGLQIFRVLLSTTISKLNRGNKGICLDTTFEKDGYLRIDNFVNSDDMNLITAEVMELVNSVPPMVKRADGSNVYENWDRGQYSKYLSIENFFMSNKFREALVKIIGIKNIKEDHLVLLVERLTQGADGFEDPETQVHEDTFHATHKGWLYINQVNPEHGPFIYYRGTHKITIRKLINIYLNSVKKTPDASRRISYNELRHFEEKIFCVPKNTLLFADTFGFHGRIKGKENAMRLALSFSYRPNPFTN
jgi:hypothetical protein